MLHILGMVLKIAVILLGSILGILLLASFLVLFVPFRYRLKGSYQGKPEAAARVTWLLSLLRIDVRYGADGLVISLKIFGIPLGRKKPDKKEKKEKKEEKEEKKPEAVPALDKERQNQERQAGKEETAEPPDTMLREEDSALLEDTSSEKLTFTERIHKIKGKIEDTIRGICDKIKNIRQKKDEFWDFITNEENQEAFRLIKRQLICLWKHTKPKKLLADCRFGFDDPALTGQVLAAASVLYPLYRDNVKLHPDFEQKIFNGEALISGRIRMFPLLLIIIRLWRNRRIRGIVMKFLK